MADTFQFDDFAKTQNPNCVACEELLTDAIDGVLSPSDQAFFDRHMAGCVECMEKFSDAQRGAAWLGLLKTQQPEPSADLMHRILAQTSGQVDDHTALLPAMLPQAMPAMPSNVLPFVPRPAASGGSRFSRFTRMAMEPRLAMTAAMAFFSIALTMNLTGVRLDQLHAADLKPSSLRRTYYEANASAVRYYDSLRVVRVLESRVDDIRQNDEDDRSDRSLHAAPESQPAAPAPEQQKLPQQQQTPEQQKAPEMKRDSPQGSSRRENPLPGDPALVRSGFTADPARTATTQPRSLHAFAAVSSPRTENRSTQEGGLV
jgi:hypothetical protein